MLTIGEADRPVKRTFVDDVVRDLSRRYSGAYPDHLLGVGRDEMSEEDKLPRGAVPLAAAIGALRDELVRAWWDRDKFLRFKPSPVELTCR